MAAKKRIKRNNEIESSRVRVIDDEGEQVGIMMLDDAVNLAKEKGLDLVEVSPKLDPPVCRVLDFGKFLFEQSKKNQSSKKKQKQVQVKEVKFRPGTDNNDYQVKLRNLTRFLEGGDKAKVTLRYRGREMAHQELGVQLLKRVEKDLSELAVVEQFPKMEGRQLVMVMSPRKN
ncbi:MAG: translation initiation factor IF-3 [Gammaproteobacteria bacterium]|nr:translation initiation factor IF-3 [Chromatiales bacterium]MDB4497925.1 translation initiation factor IF-3 [Gammaproteobacteria bacterium]MDG2154471.1 translation initiation factor IF-3 [Gammaproteobacteria bacterium]